MVACAERHCAGSRPLAERVAADLRSRGGLVELAELAEDAQDAVVVVVMNVPAGPGTGWEEGRVRITPDQAEPAELAVRGVLSELERLFLLPEDDVYTADQEEEVSGRLRALGYLE